MMKDALLSLFMCLLCTVTIAQQKPYYQEDQFPVTPFGNKEIRVDVHKNDQVIFKIDVQSKRQRNLGLLKAIPAMVVINGDTKQNSTNENQKQVKGFSPVKLSLVTGLASLGFLKSRQKDTRVLMQHFSSGGEFIKSEKLAGSKKAGTYSFEGETIIAEDGYLLVSIDNLSRNSIFTTSSLVTTPSPKRPETSRMIDTLSFGPGGGGPVTNSEESPAWENNLDGVTIVGTTASGEFRFNSPYQADMFGYASDWQAVSMPGGGNGGEGGNGPGPDPGPEEKKIARELRDIHANECETAFILDHLTDYTTMAAVLFGLRNKVENYMTAHGMGIANQNGAVPQNAFKHALLAAYMSCDMGINYAQPILDMHEICDGVNMNPSPEEWFMDDYNNDQGLHIARAVNCAGDAAIQDAVWAAYNEGILHDIDGNPTYGNPN
jgi:hypothetical protein